MKTHKLMYVLLTLFATAASAGEKINSEVKVNLLPYPNWSDAKGSIAAAQASADPYQYIGCRITVNMNSGTPVRMLFCSARTATGVAGYCSMLNPPQSIIDQLTSLRETDILWFFWNPNNGTCMEVNVDRGSGVTR